MKMSILNQSSTLAYGYVWTQTLIFPKPNQEVSLRQQTKLTTSESKNLKSSFDFTQDTNSGLSDKSPVNLSHSSTYTSSM